MTSPTPPPQPPSAESPSPGLQPRQPTGNRNVIVAIAVVVGILVGVGVGYGLFSTGDDAASNLDMACALHDDVADLDFFAKDGPGIETAEFWEMQSIGFLVAAHGYEIDDETTVELGRNLVSSVGRFDEELNTESMSSIEDLC